MGRAIVAGVIAFAVVVAAVVGGVVGHDLWRSSGTGTGNGGFANPFATPTTPSGSGPRDAGAIAQNVDPGLVDVNTQISALGLEGAGTGMVLTPNGEVLTNNHVIEGADRISVTDVGNGRTYSATVVGYDRSRDIAVLQLTGASGLKTVSLGNSSKVNVGQGVVAIGNANGTGGTPSYAGGSVTAVGQTITASDQADGSSEQLTGLIQTDAAIVSGDSGGPLVNTSGQVIGMDTAASTSFQFQSTGNEGFAIPIDVAAAVARQIESGNATGTVHIGPTAFLGVSVTSAGSCGRNPFGSGGAVSGALVCTVVPGNPAAQAGLVPGDVITALGGKTVSSAEALTTIMLGERPGASAVLTFVDSAGGTENVTVHFASGPPQ
ncbi:MAG: S1C family serine protease [Acidimicrobiales bacterium]